MCKKSVIDRDLCEYSCAYKVTDRALITICDTCFEKMPLLIKNVCRYACRNTYLPDYQGLCDVCRT